MVRPFVRLVVLIGLLSGVFGPISELVSAQLAPNVRDRVLPTAIAIAIIVEVTEDGAISSQYVPVGSGTIVSPNGLILTNWHVVDMGAIREELDTWEAQTAGDRASLHFDLDISQVLIVAMNDMDRPEPVFVARTVAEHHALDLAVLQVTGDASGRPIDAETLGLRFLPLGDSDNLLQGDPVHIFGYPAIGGGTLQYTAGVVSGFLFEEGVDGRTWITTDATIAGGSSGGAAVDDAGRLVGVPTQGSQLDCRPGDTNRDGSIDAADVGCIPIGGSFGELRPINLALDILAHAGLDLAELENPRGSATQPSIDNTSSESSISVESTPPTGDGFIPCEALPDQESCKDRAYCSTSPLYPPGTTIELPQPAAILGLRNGFILPGEPVDPPLGYDPITDQLEPTAEMPAGTVVQITGPHVELGVCDVWPISFQSDTGALIEGYLDERDLRPAGG